MATDMRSEIASFLEPAAEIAQLKATVHQLTALLKGYCQRVAIYTGCAAAANPAVGDVLRFDPELQTPRNEKIDSMDSIADDVPTFHAVPNVALLGVLVRAVQLHLFYEVRFRTTSITGNDAASVATALASVAPVDAVAPVMQVVVDMRMYDNEDQHRAKERKILIGTILHLKMTPGELACLRYAGAR